MFFYFCHIVIFHLKFISMLLKYKVKIKRVGLKYYLVFFVYCVDILKFRLLCYFENINMELNKQEKQTRKCMYCNRCIVSIYEYTFLYIINRWM